MHRYKLYLASLIYSLLSTAVGFISQPAHVQKQPISPSGVIRWDGSIPAFPNGVTYETKIFSSDRIGGVSDTAYGGAGG